MDKADCFLFGKLIKAHGIKGGLTVALEPYDQPNLQQGDSLFLEINGELVPFFLKSIERVGRQTARISFDDVDSIEQSKHLVGHRLFLPNNLLPEPKGAEFYEHEIIGFEVIDVQHGDLGRVKDVVTNSSQLIIITEKDGNEVLIPIVEQIVLKVDRNKQLIEVETPEGLIELYLKG